MNHHYSCKFPCTISIMQGRNNTTTCTILFHLFLCVRFLDIRIRLVFGRYIHASHPWLPKIGPLQERSQSIARVMMDSPQAIVMMLVVMAMMMVLALSMPSRMVRTVQWIRIRLLLLLLPDWRFVATFETKCMHPVVLVTNSSKDCHLVHPKRPTPFVRQWGKHPNPTKYYCCCCCWGWRWLMLWLLVLPLLPMSWLNNSRRHECQIK